jgi:hypothetical protein
VLFRNQTVSDEQHVRFSRRLGDLEIHVLQEFVKPVHPELYVDRPVPFVKAGKGRALAVTRAEPSILLPGGELQKLSKLIADGRIRVE